MRNIEKTILVMGASDAGKSTIARHIRIIFGNPFSLEELMTIKEIIYLNILKAIKLIANTYLRLRDSKLEYVEDDDDYELIVTILELMKIKEKSVGSLTHHHWKFIKEIVSSINYREIKKYILNDKNVDAEILNFFDQIDEISSQSYVPSIRDILRCKLKSEKTIQTECIYNNVHYKFVEVEGCSSKVAEQIAHARHASALIFVVAISEYDLVLQGDQNNTRLKRSLLLFDAVCNSATFGNCEIFVFLNKIDLLEKKLMEIPLKKHFTEFSDENVFSWTTYSDISKVKVVIIGQDPYHGVNQAHGLSFSVSPGISPPPSLQNIYKELKTDIPTFQIPHHGSLVGWAKQGVLMLNACLTVEAHKPNSHQDKGWEWVTDNVISWISRSLKNVVFILWGKFAQKKSNKINNKTQHLIINSPHPSPFSANSGFFGSKPFSKANEYLERHSRKSIDWNDLPCE